MDIKTFFQKLKSAPVWVRSVAIVVVALCAGIYLFSSCSTIRTYMNSAGEVHTTVRQSVLDSTAITVNLFSK